MFWIHPNQGLLRHLSRYILVVCALSISSQTWAQLGGEKAFEFLNLPNHAKLSGIGGVNITGADPNMFLSNPALIREDYTGHLAVNYLNYVADINLMSAAYTHDFEKVGLLSFGVQYMGYGDFQGFDPSGAATGDFNASEFAITVGKSHSIGPFTMGANMKWVGSSIDNLNASALLFDLGGVFIHPEKELTAGIAIKNIGFRLSDYTGTANSELPTDLQVGITFKPQYMPFRLSLTGYNLFRDLDYIDDSGNTSFSEEPSTFNKIFRRITIGTELIFSENFQLRAGYNHMIRQELRLEERPGGAGFSFGFMFRVKTFEFAYTYAPYHVSGAGNYFTVMSNLSKMFKKTAEEND